MGAGACGLAQGLAACEYDFDSYLVLGGSWVGLGVGFGVAVRCWAQVAVVAGLLGAEGVVGALDPGLGDGMACAGDFVGRRAAVEVGQGREVVRGRDGVYEDGWCLFCSCSGRSIDYR